MGRRWGQGRERLVPVDGLRRGGVHGNRPDLCESSRLNVSQLLLPLFFFFSVHRQNVSSVGERPNGRDGGGINEGVGVFIFTGADRFDVATWSLVQIFLVVASLVKGSQAVVMWGTGASVLEARRGAIGTFGRTRAF